MKLLAWTRAAPARLLSGLGASLVLWGCSPTPATHGVPNLVEVGSGLLRGGQPSAEGWKWLKEKGVTAVVKLNYESEGSDDEARRLGLRVIVNSIEPAGLDGKSPEAILNAALKTRVVPSDESIANAVRAMDAHQGVMYVHCSHGQDRTGLVVGVYRVLHDGLTKDDAYQEMLHNHFHAGLHGLHDFWERFDVVRWQARRASWKESPASP
jgi:protein tyrosine/serine phosphatase